MSITTCSTVKTFDTWTDLYLLFFTCLFGFSQLFAQWTWSKDSLTSVCQTIRPRWGRVRELKNPPWGAGVTQPSRPVCLFSPAGIRNTCQALWWQKCRLLVLFSQYCWLISLLWWHRHTVVNWTNLKHCF